MSLIQKDALRTMIMSYFGLGLGYVNKGVLFVLFLSTSQIGLVNLITSVGLLFAQAANLGTIYTIAKFFPFFKNKEKNNHGFLLLTTLIVIGGVAIFAIVAFLFEENISNLYLKRSKEFIDYYYWIIPIGLANVLFLLFENYLKAQYKNFLGIIANEIISRILTLIVLLLYGYKVISFEYFLIIFFIIYFVPALMLFVYLLKNKDFTFTISSISIPKRFKKIIFSFTFFNYINTLGALFVLTIDSLMITAFLGLEKNGVYSQIIFLTSALMIPYRSLLRIGSAFVPYYWKDRNMEKMQILYQKISSVSLLIGLLMFSFIWINIDDLFSFLPKEYYDGIWVFLFIMIGRLIDMYFGINGTIFITSKKYKYDIIFTMVLILLVIVLNLLLIPLYGVIGSAIATSIGYIIYNVGRLVFVYFKFNLHPFNLKQFYLILLFFISILVGEIIFPLTHNTFLNICIHTTYIVITLCLPIYLLKLEPNTIEYIKNGLQFVRKKVFNSKIYQ